MSLPAGTAELLDSLAEQAPVVPDALTQLELRRAGQDLKDPRLVRIVSLASQRFLAQVIEDAHQICKARTKLGDRKALRQAGLNPREKRLVLSTEDLASALKEYGVTVRKPMYYVDKPAAKP